MTDKEGQGVQCLKGEYSSQDEDLILNKSAYNNDKSSSQKNFGFVLKTF